jgi:hypothetical protein
MSRRISFRSQDKQILDDLSRRLAADPPQAIGLDPDGVQVELGLGETWFTLEAALAFGAGVLSNVVANHISNAVEVAIQKYKGKEQPAPVIEVRINGELVTYQTMAELSEALAKRLEPGPEPEKT